MSSPENSKLKGEPEAGSGFARNAAVVSGLTLMSRLTGLVRDAALAAAFGLGVVADAFFIGFLVPNLFRRLFGEGALTAAFIPHYTELQAKHPDAGARFAKLVVALLALLTGVITVLGEAALWSAWRWGDGAGWPEKVRWAVELTAVMLPYLPLVCVTALLGAVLQVHGRFGLPAAVPVVLNAAMIGAAAWGMRSGWGGREVAGLIGLAVVGAGVLQVVWQAAGTWGVLARGGWGWRGWWGCRETRSALADTLRMMGPMMIGLAIFQINAMLDSLIAYALSPTEMGGTSTLLLGDAVAAPMANGAVAALQWAQRLYQFPLGVFGIAIATAIFPALAIAAGRARGDAGGNELAGGDGGDAFDAVLRRGLRLTMFIALPASLGLIVVREPLVRVVYERGAFSVEDARRVAWILMGYAASVWAYSLTHVLTRAFYALKDAKTPVRVSLAMVSLNLTLNVILIWPLGAAGLAWSTAISGTGQAVVLLWLLGRRSGTRHRLVDRAVGVSWLKTAGATAVMGGVTWGVLHAVDAPDGAGWRQGVTLASTVVAGGLAYLGVSWAVKSPELGQLPWRRLRGR